MNVKLSKEEKVLVKVPKQVADIMQQILRRENGIGKVREHFWVIGLNTDTRILYVELVALGSRKDMVIEPMQIFKMALQKNASNIMLCHNHTSSNIRPTAKDRDITDRIIQVGKIIEIEVLDHLIISSNSKLWYSFAETGLLEELGKSLMYVPKFDQVKRIKQIERSESKKEIVLNMKQRRM